MDNKVPKYEYVKQRTLEIYDSMPQEKELRKKCLKERDEIIDLNYAFFGYVASKTYVRNNMATYEDKLQSALMHFCECFWWYKWKGDETHRGYRDDLSFTVFFKPRIGEMIERELAVVKYSHRRTLCMKVGEMLGKHWAKVTYEDLSDPRVVISGQEMASLKAIFGALYNADIDSHALFISAPYDPGTDELITDKYDTIEELLIQEMIAEESKLNEKQLKRMSEVYDVPVEVLVSKQPLAEQMLYNRLKSQKDIKDAFEGDEYN